MSQGPDGRRAIPDNVAMQRRTQASVNRILEGALNRKDHRGSILLAAHAFLEELPGHTGGSA